MLSDFFTSLLPNQQQQLHFCNELLTTVANELTANNIIDVTTQTVDISALLELIPSFTEQEKQVNNKHNKH